jgi:enoyl-[acyl-carrier protein] reductase II
MIKVLDKLWERGAAFLGTQYALMGGAMTWVSERNLVSAMSNAGGFGVLAAGAMPPHILREEIQETRKMTQFPFGVNLIILHPNLEDLAQVCIDEKVSHVVLAGGLPSAAVMDMLKSAHIKIICLAPSLLIARKLIKMGANALVLEGTEAGGHIGPVSTTVLTQEILPHIKEVPVFIAGGIGRGEAILSYLEMGAAGCQLGTRLVCAYECQAHPKFKESFLRANARDAVPSIQLDPRFPVIPVRALENEGTTKFREFQQGVIDRFNKGEISQKEGQMEIEHFWAGALRRAVVDGDVETGSIMAGQSVGLVKMEQSMEEIIRELVGQALETLEGRVR